LGRGYLSDGKLAFEDTDDFTGIGCGLQRTPLSHRGKSQTVQGVNHGVDSLGGANDQDFDGFSV
jgi:hypothetical protein